MRPDAEAALPKAEAARRKIAAFNSGIAVEAVIADLIPGNIHKLLAEAHLLLDCTDNFETRYLLNDYSVQESKPWIYAAAIGAYAATMTILPTHTACLACLFPTPPAGTVETCDTAGILGSAVNLAASLQSAEALKILTPASPNSCAAPCSPSTSGPTSAPKSPPPTPTPPAPVCAGRTFIHLAGTARPHITLCGRNSVQIHEHHRPIDLAALKLRLATHADVSALRSNALLLALRTRLEHRNRLPRRTRPHPGHHRSGRRSRALRPLHRLISRINDITGNNLSPQKTFIPC